MSIGYCSHLQRNRKKAKEIDVRGFACPRPVISTKKALEEINEGTIPVLVDNLESVEVEKEFNADVGCMWWVLEIKEVNGLLQTKKVVNEYLMQPDYHRASAIRHLDKTHIPRLQRNGK